MLNFYNSEIAAKDEDKGFHKLSRKRELSFSQLGMF